MNSRLLQFLNAENISQAQFADTIGVARASVSHILAGRTKPGFDFLVSISKHYPSLNLEWLITGKGRMYLKSCDTIFDDSEFFTLDKETKAAIPPQTTNTESIEQKKIASQPSFQPSPEKSISRIIVFYNDNTYQELV